NLLRHVGKSPEVTMGARLAALVMKGDKENPLVRVKPGVFALREWDTKMIERGLADRTPALERIAAAGVEVPEPSEPNGAADEEAELATDIEEDAPPPAEDEIARAQFAADATQIFEPEE